MDAEALRSRFPVLAGTAYLNAGTCGPSPTEAVTALGEAAERAAHEGRAGAHLAQLGPAQNARRERCAGLMNAAPEDVAVTTATSEGVVRVLQGLSWSAGDEVLTAEGEHPGLLGPLGALARERGIEVRTVPLERIAEEVGPRTRLVACSHVRWIDGALAPAALAELSDDVPVLLDGAQGLGAVQVDVEDLGCAFYAAAGQKWLCGPIGTGVLWIAPRWRERLTAVAPTYVNLADAGAGLAARPWADARAFDAIAVPLEVSLAANAAFDVLAAAGWPEVHARAAALAAELADGLAARGRRVAPRGATTLVSWSEDDPSGTCARLADAGVVVRDLPGTHLLRASVGAWNDASDLERLLVALPA